MMPLGADHWIRANKTPPTSFSPTMTSTGCLMLSEIFLANLANGESPLASGLLPRLLPKLLLRLLRVLPRILLLPAIAANKPFPPVGACNTHLCLNQTQKIPV